MQKKVFLQKGRIVGGGRSPYVKYLLWAALGLMLLVLITPYLLDRGKGVSKRPILAEKGTLKKELPKPPEPAPEKSLDGLPGGLAAIPEPAPEPLKPPEPEQPPAQPAPAPPEPQAAKPAEPPRDLFPKSGGPAPAPSMSAKAPPSTGPSSAQPPSMAPKAPPASSSSAPAASMIAKAPPPKPPAKAEKKVPGLGGDQAAAAPVKGKGTFAVQVGYFKEKQSAEEVRRNLQKKGYDVVLCPSKAGNGYAYSVVTKPVASLSKAATLVEQIKNEKKVSPTIIKAPGACDVDGKSAATPVSVSKKLLKQPVVNGSTGR